MDWMKAVVRSWLGSWALSRGEGMSEGGGVVRDPLEKALPAKSALCRALVGSKRPFRLKF